MTTEHPTQDVLLQFLRQELDPEQERTVDAHVGSCPDCERQLSQLAGGLPRALDPVARLVGEATLVPDRTELGSESRRPAAATLVQVPGYDVLAEVGRGGMGVVYKARHIQLGRLVALKMMPSGVGIDAEQRRRFRLEAAAVARLAHPNIVQIYDVGEHEGQPFLVLEFIDGGSLAQRLGGQPWPAPDAARLVEDLAGALHAAHQHGIVHRDLKPSNVLLQGVGSGESGSREKTDGPSSLHPPHSPLPTPKITDFGLAKFLTGASSQTQSGQILGTPSYMAPEQAAGQNSRVGPATDVYALGATLYELLTGRPPFVGESLLDVLEQVRCEDPIPPRRLRHDLPRDLETICLKCLHREPEKRYPSALALAEDLRRWRQHEPIAARRPGRTERFLLWARRRPAAALAALFLVLLVAVGSVALGLWLEARGKATRPLRGSPTPRDIQGHWVGTLSAGADRVRLIVTFTTQADGSVAGTYKRDDARGVEWPIDEIRFEDGVLRFAVKGVGGVYEGRLKEDGRELVGEWKEPGWLLALSLRHQAEEPTFARAQEPKRPYPCREENVTYLNPKAGVKLAGALTLPPGQGPFPAVLLLPGSWSQELPTSLGPRDRDETMFSHKPFLVLADHLTRRGIAVLRVDDRGVGGSTGHFEKATMDDFAEDALAGLAFLKTRQEIDPARIGLIARHGKGGIIAPLAAAQSRDVAVLVLLAGSGLKGEENQILLNDFRRQVSGWTEKARARERRIEELLFRIVEEHKDEESSFKKFESAWDKELARLVQDRKVPASKQALWGWLKESLTPWYRFYLSHDPQPALRKVPCPVLALTGEKDRIVPPRENLPKIVQALQEGGNKDLTVKELPGLNHLFQTSKTGDPAEYGEIEETFAPAALELISEWILKRFGPQGSK
jgi:pimeloyl-ACP methyl ester carboxylesterase